MADEDKSTAASWGWGILLVIATLIALNGVSWIVFGPDAVVSDMAENIGVSVDEFEDAYPAAVDEIAVNQYQVAIYLVAIGGMGFLAALAGYRLRYRWAWRITWVLVAIPAALVGGGLAAGFGLAGFLTLMLLLALIALVGQLLARRGLGKQEGGSVSAQPTTT